MKILMVLYLLFIIGVALGIVYLTSKLRVRIPGGLFLIILLVIVSPVLISYFFLSYLAPLPETIVPDLYGLPEKEARQSLDEAGLQIHIEKKYEGDDEVTFQRPEPGRKVREGRAVTIIVGNPKAVNYLPLTSTEAVPETTASDETPSDETPSDESPAENGGDQP
jgi:beta-lactam-binding protein with PASTA domain